MRRVTEITNFWRKTAVEQLKEKRPQADRNPEWLQELHKDFSKDFLEEKQDYWKKLISKEKDKETDQTVERGRINKENIQKKEHNWEMAVSDDSWYRLVVLGEENNGFNARGRFPLQSSSVLSRTCSEQKNGR